MRRRNSIGFVAGAMIAGLVAMAPLPASAATVRMVDAGMSTASARVYKMVVDKNVIGCKAVARRGTPMSAIMLTRTAVGVTMRRSDAGNLSSRAKSTKVKIGGSTRNVDVVMAGSSFSFALTASQLSRMKGGGISVNGAPLNAVEMARVIDRARACANKFLR